MMWSRLPQGIEKIRKEVEAAAKKCGLDFFDTEFFIVDSGLLNSIAANAGFPERYPHWRFGMEYEQLGKQTGHGLARIYEQVINTEPAVAYLLNYNSPSLQKMVIAHAYAHVDFFKNNIMFSGTDRKMVERMKDHARIIQKHIDKQGLEAVEKFIDACISLENLIEPNPLPGEDSNKECRCRREDSENEEEEGKAKLLVEIPEHMREFVNMDNFTQKPEKKEECECRKKKKERDILAFLIKNAEGLKQWQKDILSIARYEAYYFQPQRQTKIMNEGWATFWHDYLLIHEGLCEKNGLLDYAKAMGQMASRGQGFNPYYLGCLLFADIKERWDKGRHGGEYEEEPDMEKRGGWDMHEGRGLEKMFEVRATFNDAEFLRTFLTDDFIRKELFFEYELDEFGEFYRIAGRNPARIRNMLIEMLTNEPVIRVEDDNYHNSRQLVLRHEYAGAELEQAARNRTMRQLYHIWQRPVHLITVYEGSEIMVSFNGKKIDAKK